MAGDSDLFANDPFSDDLLADPFAEAPLGDGLLGNVPGDGEWLAGTSWRDAFELPLDDLAEPLVPEEPDPSESAPWEVDG